MQRNLMLILNGGKENKMPSQSVIGLTLETMDSEQLDAYISTKFESSDDIRKRYEKEINHFLDENYNFVQSAEEKLGRKFNGAIVIAEIDENLVLERKKVLYKKHRIIFNEITNIKKFMLAIAARDSINAVKAREENRKYDRLFSEFHARELQFHSTTDEQFRRVVGQWRNQIHNSPSYYETVRRVLKEYENRYKELGLYSPDIIYSMHQTISKGNQSFRSPRETKIEELEQLKHDVAIVTEEVKPVEQVVQEDNFEQLAMEGFGPVKKYGSYKDLTM